ncbi:MAG: N-acetylmannosamine-6-phosphate 2-epimerase [Cyanobacteria bacterium]|nr:N-acetylmannosamine-6-phosphate 2-epimerase [Cyanobacteriota bacterium]
MACDSNFLRQLALRVSGGLIVSVQAPPGSPLRDPYVIAAMAEACLANGAVGVRLESPEHIAAVRQRCPSALIVGLWKRTFPHSDVYITPGWHEVQSVWAAGADVVALDATDRIRPDGDSLEILLQRIHQELSIPIMADVDSLISGLKAAELGCAWIGTTLYGYTKTTDSFQPPAWELVTQLRAELPADVLLICEGGISTSSDAVKAMNEGADAVVVGTAITGIDLQVANYCKKITQRPCKS